MGRVDSKVILITGAASGLGLADARLLTKEGAQVVMTDVNRDVGEAVARELGAVFLHHDVSDEKQWLDVMAEVETRYGRLNGIVNNAGVAPIANIETTSTEVWRKTFAIHLDGTFFGCREAVKLMKPSGGGSIVNMSSTAALVGIPAYLAYSAAKGGIRSMTKAIAVHAKNQKLGIRCNSVHPGSISTPMVHGALESLLGIDLPGADDPEAKRVEMGIGEPNDVAQMILYLMSDESKHVNGAELVIDNADTID
jgi:3(or 17)beta-hydroxysteroid dehydrogenase